MFADLRPNEKIIQTLYRVLSSLNFLNRLFQTFDKHNTLYFNHLRFIALILYPFFDVKDTSHYANSRLHKIFSCGKDVFYDFLNAENFDWRKIAYKVNLRLIKKIKKHTNDADNQNIRCLIADDTDLAKSGRKFELLSRIYSHVINGFRYGFKGLFLGYHDGKSTLMLDFSLHGEKGNQAEKPYGLTKKQQNQRFENKRRTKDSSSQIRVDEYFKKKTDMLIEMVRTAIAKGIRFDYLLTDSWFTNFELIKFITARRIKCHFLGRIKNETTKYLFNGRKLTFNGILNILKHSKKSTYDKKLRCWYYEAEVEFNGIKIKLFFSKLTKRGKWNGLLTTNTELTFIRAFEIYATRWVIEVFSKNVNNIYVWVSVNREVLRRKSPQQRLAYCSTICSLWLNVLSATKHSVHYFEEQKQN
jgi:hypothetical protein